MTEKELLRRHGEAGTFIVGVKHRDNNNWQGQVTWVEEKKTIPFESVLNLLKLIDGAVEPEEVGKTFIGRAEND